MEIFACTWQIPSKCAFGNARKFVAKGHFRNGHFWALLAILKMAKEKWPLVPNAALVSQPHVWRPSVQSDQSNSHSTRCIPLFTFHLSLHDSRSQSTHARKSKNESLITSFPPPFYPKNNHVLKAEDVSFNHRLRIECSSCISLCSSYFLAIAYLATWPVKFSSRNIHTYNKFQATYYIQSAMLIISKGGFISLWTWCAAL